MRGTDPLVVRAPIAKLSKAEATAEGRAAAEVVTPEALKSGVPLALAPS